MNKNWKSSKYIHYNKRHSRKQKEKSDRYKLYKKRIRNNERGYNDLPEVKNTSKALKSKHKAEVVLTVPKNFSLEQNIEETLCFINHLNLIYKKKKPVFINLKDVENIGYETIVVLLANLIKFKNGKIDFNGNFPDNTTARERLEQSKFFEVLYSTQYKTHSYNLNGNGIYTHTKKNVDSELGLNLIFKASKFIWGEERFCKGVQRTLIELMQNTNNHAGKNPGEKKWWVSINCVVPEKKVIFSFVDFGKGIFSSLSNQSVIHRWFDWYNRLSKENGNDKILKYILTGNMHRTVTGQSHRGKGLPGIYEAFEMNYLSNLFILSNDVLADVRNDRYIKLDLNFKGTFVWWELNEFNKSTTIK
jgi:hypothetical protein